MGNLANYWSLVRLEASGSCRLEELASARAFCQQQFSDLKELSDTAIQQQLWQLIQAQKNDLSQLAELCLRCYLSHLIQQICVQLENQFGQYYQFTRSDLFPLVLTDDGKNYSGDYQPLSLLILQTFDPELSSLATWAARLVRQHRDLNTFLLECGLCMLSDWAILNDTSSRQLGKILSDRFVLTPIEIQQAITLLESYHLVYREDRIQQRRSGSGGRCSPPTLTQLEAIGQLIQEQTGQVLSPKRLLDQLLRLADRLRQYRIESRGGRFRLESLDAPGITTRVQEMPAESNSASEGDTGIQAFLQFYRQQFSHSLHQALDQVIQERLQRLKPPKADHYLTALYLLHCLGQSMTEIAPQIGLKAQFEVSRLLKLKELRADIRHWMVKQLLEQVIQQAGQYMTLERLKQQDQAIESFLNEQIDQLIREAEMAARTDKRYVEPTRFARSLCTYLDARSNLQ